MNDLVIKVLSELQKGELQPQVGLLFSLVICEAVLSKECHKAILSGDVDCYQVHGQTVVEFQLRGGWIDRRFIGGTTFHYLSLNRGVKLDHNIKSAAENFLKLLLPQVEKKSQWSSFQRHAYEFWKDRLPGVLMGHCLGDGRFQLLDKRCIWRGATRAVTTPMKMIPSRFSDSIVMSYSKRTESIQLLLQGIRSVVARKHSKVKTRQAMLDLVDQVLLVAKNEGRVQFVTVSSLGEVIQFGGVQGKVLAPGSIAQYASLVLLGMVEMLLEFDQEDDPTILEQEYRKIIDRCSPSQRPKAAAMLQALHNRLVLRGVPLLPKALSADAPQLVPAAAYIWPHEIEFAKEFIQNSDEHSRVKGQAQLVLALGSKIPLRTYEYFELRVVDVLPDGCAEVKVAPRRGTSKDKSLNSHLRHLLSEPQLTARLYEHKSLRLAEEDAINDVDASRLHFFGMPGYQGPFRAEPTMTLVNKALKWATGEACASVYDLRHTAISRRASAAWNETEDSDVLAWEQLSRGCGHGDVSATRFYVHSIEEPLTEILHAAIPHEPSKPPELNSYTPRLLEELFIEEGRPFLPESKAQDSNSVSNALDFERVNWILSNLSSGRSQQYVKTACNLEYEDLDRIVQSAHEAWIGTSKDFKTVREQRIWLQMKREYAQVSRQHKYSQLAQYLQSLAEQQSWVRLRHIYRISCCCVTEDAVDMTRGSAALELLAVLRDAGYSKSQLVVKADDIRSPNISFVGRQVGTVLAQTPRRGRPKARLFLIPANVSAAEARGATVSVSGLHWIFGALGALLWMKGES